MGKQKKTKLKTSNTARLSYLPSKRMAEAVKASQMRYNAFYMPMNIHKSLDMAHMTGFSSQMLAQMCNLQKFAKPQIDMARVFASQKILSSSIASWVRQMQVHTKAIEVFQNAIKPSRDIWTKLRLAKHLSTPRAVMLGSLLDQSKRLAAVTRRIADIAKPMDQLAEKLQVQSQHIRLFLPDVERLTSSSEESVSEANDFFSEPHLPLRYQQDVKNYPELGRFSESAFEEQQRAQMHLHQGTSLSIISVNNIAWFIRESIKEEVAQAIAPYQALMRRLNTLTNPRTFLELLKSFAQHFTQHHWKSLWEKPGDKFHSNPEQIAKAVLGTFLNGACLGTGFVGTELLSGDGFVDILVNVLGQNHIVELKVIGKSSQGVGWAKSGLAQLERYMRDYEQDIAYLALFDGRKTELGKQLKNSYSAGVGTIHVIVVRSYLGKGTKM